ncbi:hypothetical protein [Noviherbaspirillum sp. Root189]|uniref:hypothetical protein n=1 Tax=Noviherbaspirillum sp. Root189 TaxID=1736487 RepID=UPI0012E39BB6|nr:hypothetical protein [Noviherbaspirillum sp. Root189]
MPGQINRKKLVIAVREVDKLFTQAILGDAFDVVLCHTLEDAKAAIDEQVGMVVCGVHFAQGAVFELLQFVRSNPVSRQVPFFVMLDTAGRYNYSPAIVHGLRAAAKALGATGFTDLSALVEKTGREEAIEILRRGIQDALHKPD